MLGNRRPVTRTPQLDAPDRGQLQVRLNSAPRRSGKAMHKEHHAVLMSLSSNLPEPPKTYDPEKQYRVRLNRVVVVPQTNHVLRPSDDVIVSGQLAATIAENIVGAQAL